MSLVVLTLQDSGKNFILNTSRIVSIEDLGAYRVVTYMLTDILSSSVCIKEDTEGLFKIFRNEPSV